ncbi:MAG: hypothetical protein WA865_23585 [Spirulinaceae cyanobacterium]
MKDVLSFIEQKKEEFSQLPLMAYLQDQSISPQKRLAFAPCIAPFAMEFRHFNKYVLRQESSSVPAQKLINKHTHEDERHWYWFIEDLEKLGFDGEEKMSDILKFLWGKDTTVSRHVCQQLEQCLLEAEQADPNLRIVVSEAIEATGVVMFGNTTAVAQELQKITQKDYRYFGRFHLDLETGHLTGTDNVETVLEKIQLSPQSRIKAFELVERVFDIFAELTHELLAFAKNNQKSLSSHLN